MMLSYFVLLFTLQGKKYIYICNNDECINYYKKIVGCHHPVSGEKKRKQKKIK